MVFDLSVGMVAQVVCQQHTRLYEEEEEEEEEEEDKRVCVCGVI